ncbi:uncharacterized protein LOC132196652 [Neocloeon triangulifer]|uniref:uncharacterized protein LOC132196652 n=1 Tax=Neocloeon triangulifer TaxID=2078957 RepID=UPI00286F9A94|nr:uncharacterized protein LOC132196652 [Neocloeon triangulifer]
MLRGQRKQFAALLGFFVVLGFLLNALERARTMTVRNQVTKKKDAVEKFIVDASGCQILDLKAFSASAREYVKQPEPLVCSKKRGNYRVSRALDEDYVEKSSVPSKPPKGLECCYRHIIRRSKDDGNIKFSEDCRPMDELLMPESAMEIRGDDVPEFVRISCKKPGKDEEWVNDEYVDYRFFVPVKSEVEDRCNGMPKRPNEVSVLILGIDSVSRLNAERLWPKTIRILNEMSAVTLLGYNKVADNTFPNLVPVLIGQSVEELNEVCGWPEASKAYMEKFDECPFLWRTFSEMGFRTMLAEECTHLTTFNFQKGGFAEPPTDYYPRPLFIAAEEEVGHTHADNCVLCQGPRSQMSVLFNYAQKFASRFALQRYFAFVWATSLTHDGLNMAALADEPVSTTIENLRARGDLKRTVLVVLSDHGVRTGDFRLHPQGRLEERLPFLSFIFPPWFESQFPEAIANFKQNAHARLTTPYDLHFTLKDLIDPANTLNRNELATRQRELDQENILPRGMSMFLRIPEWRNCSAAHIPRHWCACLTYQPLSLDDPDLQTAALALVEHINEKFLNPHPQCRQLTLLRVVEARVGLAPENGPKEETSGLRDYAMTVETSPGGALLEGAVRAYRHRGRNNVLKYEVADTVSRVNRYGSQSRCVDDWVAKLYCYCD